MAAVAVGLRGTVAGVAIVTCLAAFALSRALSSVAYKDVLGRTISKGGRGRVGGIASAVSGVAAIVFGLGLRQLGPESGAGVLAIALAGASGLWVLATLTFGFVEEPAGGAEESDKSGLAEAWTLLRSDQPFRKFVTTRALLLVSALSPPFVVILASAGEGADLSGLGAFVIAQGLAAMVGGRSWGVMADRSSRLTMVVAATAASAAIAAFLVVGLVVDDSWLYPLAYFLIALTHEGVRLGRSTYVTDMAEGNQRTAYVAASNTAMGALLLVAGAITSGLALLGPRAALVFLLLGGLAGAWNGLRLPEVSAS
jgi:predicted MFS family arabinose efflux permease